MGLAPYFRRSAVAAAQVIAGFSEDAIRQRLENVVLEIAIGRDSDSPQRDALIDLAVRMAARLYPRLRLSGSDSDRWIDLAQQINPEIDMENAVPTISVGIGAAAPESPRTIFLGSDGWDALVSTEHSLPIGTGDNPFGPGAAACFGLANVFRWVFLDGDDVLDNTIQFSTFTLEPKPGPQPAIAELDLGEAVLVGVGAVGNATAWGLSRTSCVGTMHLVDGETLETDNMQRYVLAAMRDDKRPKVDIAQEFFTRGLRALGHQQTWAAFTTSNGHSWRRVLVALDSAEGRREVAAGLPQWVGNAWTQPGDFGVSVHPSFDSGACLNCLYLPRGEAPSEDQLIANALGLTAKEHLMMIRVALFKNAPLPQELVDVVANNLGTSSDDVRSFADKPVRELYRRGLCGGELIPLERLGQPAQQVHVPLAHQSALAGVLLAARLVASGLGLDPESCTVAQIDLLRRLPEYPVHPVAKDPRGICICQDEDYRHAYKLKFTHEEPGGALRHEGISHS